MIKSSLEDNKRSKAKSSNKQKDAVKNSAGDTDDSELYNSVRPVSLGDIVGRINEKKKIKMMIDAAGKRKEVIDHVLFYGPPGLGKTTFAMAIATEMQGNIHVTSGPTIKKQGDLATLLTNLTDGDVLFIDEIHRLSKGIEEILYPAMEDRKLDVVIGKGVSAKVLRLNLKPFTLIGATTRIGMISSPMRDRFGLVQRLDFLGNEDLYDIVTRASGIWNIEIEKKGAQEIAKRSRGTPRIALRLLRRVRDYYQSYEQKESGKSKGSKGEILSGGHIDKETVRAALNLLGVDKYGLEDLDRKILTSLLKDHQGGPVGITTLAASVAEDPDTIADVHEPYLLKSGLLKRTNRGRVLTGKGIEYSGKLAGEESNSDSLFN